MKTLSRSYAELSGNRDGFSQAHQAPIVWWSFPADTQGNIAESVSVSVFQFRPSPLNLVYVGIFISMSSVITFRSFNQENRADPLDIIGTGLDYLSWKIDRVIMYSSISPWSTTPSRFFITHLHPTSSIPSFSSPPPFFTKKYKPRDPVGTDLCVHWHVLPLVNDARRGTLHSDTELLWASPYMN